MPGKRIEACCIHGALPSSVVLLNAGAQHESGCCERSGRTVRSGSASRVVAGPFGRISRTDQSVGVAERRNATHGTNYGTGRFGRRQWGHRIIPDDAALLDEVASWRHFFLVMSLRSMPRVYVATLSLEMTCWGEGRESGLLQWDLPS